MMALRNHFLLNALGNLLCFHMMKMQMQEQFFKEQIKLLHETRDEKEENFERLQQEEREKMKQTNVGRSNTDEYRSR